jgi:hypothetical protein
MTRHQPGRNADDELHDAEVVEDGKKRADENDDRQHLKRKNKPDVGDFSSQVHRKQIPSRRRRN